MKFLSKFLLVIFITFLSTPTIVTLIKKNTDITFFYSFSEEEIHKELKQIKGDFRQNFDHQFVEIKIKSNCSIISENFLGHDSFAIEIFSPPPELM